MKQILIMAISCLSGCSPCGDESAKEAEKTKTVCTKEFKKIPGIENQGTFDIKCKEVPDTDNDL